MDHSILHVAVIQKMVGQNALVKHSVPCVLRFMSKHVFCVNGPEEVL